MFVAFQSPSHFQFYAVYDGHAGLEAAKYSAVHLHCHLAGSLRNGLKINEAFKEAFAKTDRLFVDYAKREVSQNISIIISVCVLWF